MPISDRQVFRQRLSRRAAALLIVSTAVTARRAQSQGAPRPITGAVPVSTAGLARVETEIIEITNAGGFPSVIKRKSGKFVLAVVNKTTHNAPVSVVLTSAAVPASAVASLTQALNLGALAKLRRVTALIDPPAGVYTLKSETTGKVLATITIQ